MKKIVMVPLDERPCNYNFPKFINIGDNELIMPPKALMGNKKRAGYVDLLADWVLKEVTDADYAILSMDTLVYGGIVPSRLHRTNINELYERSKIVEKIKQVNPKIKVFGYQLIMRCPWYSLSDEEPDYYAYYGSEIHRYGKYKHLQQLGMMSKEDLIDLEKVNAKLDFLALEDFMLRRDKNINVLMHNLAYVKNGVIDFFVVPQDDTAVYGFASLDQQKVRKYIADNYLHDKIPMYPSADEVGLTMLGRVLNDINDNKPKIFVHYASSKGPFVIPSFEDRLIDETLKHQIIASGSRRVYSLIEADIMLAINIGSEMLNHNEKGYDVAYGIERNLVEFIDQINYAKSLGKIVAIADVAHANGGDIEMLTLLSKAGLTLKVDAYAGWNTSSNSIGTALSQAISVIYNGDSKENKRFLIHRYFEDLAYGAYTRMHITNNNLEMLGYDYFNVGSTVGAVSHLATDTMMEYMKKHLPEVHAEVDFIEVEMPWVRMFEIDLRIILK